MITKFLLCHLLILLIKRMIKNISNNLLIINSSRR